MIILRKKGKSIKFYSSIKETKINRYTIFNNLVREDLGVGSGIEDITKHYQKLHALIANKKNSDALMELQNLWLSHVRALDEINTKSLSLCSMVHSIDGKIFDDLSEESLMEISNTLSHLGVTQKEVEFYLEDVKKNLTPN